MRNIEALRNYFLGKDPQLEVTLADNSLRLSGIEGKHYILRGELIKRLTDLKTAMEDADTVLQNNIDAEALARSQEDNALDGKITQEANIRSGADNLLTNAINTVAGNLNTLSNNVYTKAQVDYLINEIPKFDIEIVQSLPTQDISETTIYLLPLQDGEVGNGYEEYIYINNNWELIGTTNIDLSDYYTKEEVNAKTFINTLTQDVTIPETSEINPLLLSTGWWYTGEHVIYYGESVEPTIYNNALFYFNAEAGDQWLYFLPPNLEDGWNQLGTYLWFDNTDHIWQYSGYGVVTVIDNHSTDMSIPTAGAVYEFVISKGAGIKALTSPVTIWDLEDGVYLLPASCEVRYGGGMYWAGSKALLYVGTENTTTKRYFIFDCVGAQNNIVNGTTTANSGTIKYFSVSLDYEITNNKVTSLSSSSTDTQYPSAKCVYDSLPTNFTGTDGVNAGTSGLVPAPATTDAGKFLRADGTWQTAGGGFTPITSNTSIYSLAAGTYVVSSGVTLQYSSSGTIAIPSNLQGYLFKHWSGSGPILGGGAFTLIIGPSSYVGTASNPMVLGPSGYITKIETQENLVTSISSSSTDAQYPSAKAVYDYAQPKITYGTTDLTPGVSPLNDGEFYFVYE